MRIVSGGQSIISEDDYVEGAPELIVEIAASTGDLDLNDKLNIYRRNGVQEYIVWRVEDGEIDWFGLEQGVYIQWEPDAEGLYRSNIFPGLWLDLEAWRRRDLARVLTVVRRTRRG